MHVFVTVQHPAHVHFFRPTVEELLSDGHEVSVYAREKDLAVDLLRASGIPHEVLVGEADSLGGLVAAQARYEWRLFREARRRDPDVVTGIGGLAAAHVGRLTGTPSVVFTDTELASNWLTAPFADLMVTPAGFEQSLGDGHVRYDGFQELAYLHPDRFEFDPGMLRTHGVDPNDPYSVVRFGSMAAHHDVGRSGFARRQARDLVDRLAAFGPVYVSAEDADEQSSSSPRSSATRGDTVEHSSTCPPSHAQEDTDNGAFPGKPIPVPPAAAHQLLAAADVVATDTHTMAAEAGLLGRPTVRLRPPDEDLSNFRAFEAAGLVHSSPSPSAVVDEAVRLAGDPTAVDRWRRRRDALLDDCVDVTDVVLELLTTTGTGRDRVKATGVGTGA